MQARPGCSAPLLISALVRRDDHARGCGQAVDEFEIDAWSSFVEEAVPLAEHERVHEQHQSVDKLQQQLTRPAGRCQRCRGRGLARPSARRRWRLRRQKAGPSSASGRLGECVGDDVLGHLIEVRRKKGVGLMWPVPIEVFDTCGGRRASLR